ncbi:MAG: septum formation initiator family protein [Clostridia bacterium]|nr:septum formation initiator family protein [Clostridia bacterium]
MTTHSNLFVRIAMVVIIAVCVFTIVRLQIQFNELNDTRKQLTEQVKNYSDSIEQKSEELEKPFDREYIIAIAREKLGYHLPDEIIYYNDLN